MPSYGGVGHRPRAVERYLLSGERCVVAVRKHWIVIAEPWLTTLGSLLLVAWLTFDVADPRIGRPLDLLWWLWFAVLARAIWMTIDHSHTWFVATDRRLLLLYGIFVRRVAMMPLAKVTDMSYHRSPTGWLLGYGTFVLESAGQEQALRVIDHVPHPDPAYRAIISEIFHASGDKVEPSVDEDGTYERDDVDPAGAAWADDLDDDPTSRLSLSADDARGWSDRLRSPRGSRTSRTSRGAWLPGRRDRFPGAHPDPSVGARYEVRNSRSQPPPSDGAADGGEWLYRGRSQDARDQDKDPYDGDEPPRDATGYWG